jgi:hypothetical protein
LSIKEKTIKRVRLEKILFDDTASYFLDGLALGIAGFTIGLGLVSPWLYLSQGLTFLTKMIEGL